MRNADRFIVSPAPAPEASYWSWCR